jgi:hypothetical protein
MSNQVIRVTETGSFWGGDEMLAGVTVETLSAEWHAVLPVAEAAVVAKKIRSECVVDFDEAWLNVTEATIAQWEQDQDDYYAGQRIDY